MALSDPEINLLRLKSRDPFDFARAIEAEVRKQDDALILQLVETLEDFDDEGPLGEGWKSDRLLSLLTSARAAQEGGQ